MTILTEKEGKGQPTGGYYLPGGAPQEFKAKKNLNKRDFSLKNGLIFFGTW